MASRYGTGKLAKDWPEPYESRADKLERHVEELKARPRKGEEVWDRLKGENVPAFAAFECYRQMPPYKRSVREVGRQLGFKERYPAKLYNWSNVHHWAARAIAWDEHMAKTQQAESKAALRDMCREHVDQVKVLRAISNLHLRRVADQLRSQAEEHANDPQWAPGYLTAETLLKWIKVGQELETDRRYQLFELDSPTQAALAALVAGGPQSEEQWHSLYVEPENVWIPHEKQRLLISDTARFCAAVAGVQSGKTSGGAIAAWRRIMEDSKRLAIKGQRGYWWLIAPTALIGEVMCEAFEQYAPPGWIETAPKGKVESGRTWALKDGGRVQFRSADRKDDLVARRLNGAWLDEFTLLKKSVWTSGVRQRLSTTNGWCLFTSIPRGRNWAYEEIWRRTDPNDDKHDKDYSGITWHSVENPAIPRIEIESAQRQLPPAYFKREYLADWSSFHGQIYTSWNAKRHRRKGLASRPLPEGAELVMALDWGMTNPGAMLVARKLLDGSYHLVEELHQADKLSAWWNERIVDAWQRHKVVRIWGDPEQPDRIGTLRELGLPIQAAYNEVQPGIRTLASLIHQDRFLVDFDACPVTAAQIESYHWTQDSKGNSREFPHKENDHTCDAARYLVHSEAQPPATVEVAGYSGHARTG